MIIHVESGVGGGIWQVGHTLPIISDSTDTH